MESIIRIAQEHVKEELYHYVEETVNPNPDTGDSWDGTNKTFQTSYYPIVDSDYDFVVDSNDVTAQWISASYVAKNCVVTVSSSTYGILTLTQSNTSAIPESAEDVIVRYYACHRNITKKQLENLTAYMAAHLVYMRLKSGTSISQVDLTNNWRLILKSPTTYLDNYYLLLGQLQNSTIKGV